MCRMAAVVCVLYGGHECRVLLEPFIFQDLLFFLAAWGEAGGWTRPGTPPGRKAHSKARRRVKSLKCGGPKG